MTKRRWVYIDGVAVEDGEAQQRVNVAVVGDRHYLDTRGPNGEDLSTRTKHREFMKQTGLTTMDDFKDTWSNAAKQREQYMQKGGTIRREDIARAIEKHRG